jgi:hypothetical protein
MNRRERILALAALALAVLAALRLLQVRWYAIRDQQSLELAAILQQSEELQDELTRAEATRRLLEEWRNRSLPSDPDMALGLYKQWLQQQLAECRIEDVNLASRASQARDGQYHVLSMRISGKGSSEQVVRFLHRFYETDLLHKIRTLSLRSTGADADKLDMQLEVEALSLPDAMAKDALPTTMTQRLAGDSVEAYVESIATRRPFAPHSAKPSAPPGRDVFISGFLDDGEGPQVWLQLRNSGQTLRLTEGDPFTAEGLSGTVRSIDPQGRTVEIETDKGSRQLNLGQELAER